MENAKYHTQSHHISKQKCFINILEISPAFHYTIFDLNTLVDYFASYDEVLFLNVVLTRILIRYFYSSL